jgi:hypothetical protein
MPIHPWQFHHGNPHGPPAASGAPARFMVTTQAAARRPDFGRLWMVMGISSGIQIVNNGLA